jgi:hypothetical protein
MRHALSKGMAQGEMESGGYPATSARHGLSDDCYAPTTADWRPKVIHLNAKWYQGVSVSVPTVCLATSASARFSTR